jgi:hypothetical protein
MNLASKNKINLTIVVFLLLIILIVVFVVSFLYREIKNNSQEVLLEKQKLAILESKITNLEKFRIIYKNLEEILVKIDGLFTDPEVPVDFITFLEDAAEESQINIKISPVALPQSKEDPWPSLGFRITSINSFPDFLMFLEKLENSQYLIEFQNINISSKEGAAGRQVAASLLIKVFTK